MGKDAGTNRGACRNPTRTVVASCRVFAGTDVCACWNGAGAKLQPPGGRATVAPASYDGIGQRRTAACFQQRSEILGPVSKKVASSHQSSYDGGDRELRIFARTAGPHAAMAKSFCWNRLAHLLEPETVDVGISDDEH